MSRGRTPRTLVGRTPVARAVEPVELLEARRLLTTLEGGQTFNYLDATLGVVRIRLVGNITAEFTAARVDKTSNRVVIRDLIQAPPPGTQNAPTEGANLFNIYIARADANAQILITKVPNASSADRLATPYAGSIGTLRALNNETVDPGTGEGGTDPTTVVTPDATGSVFIGAKTNDLASVEGSDEANIPIIFNRTRLGLGVRPAGRGLFAGIQTAPGVSMGKVLIGGTILGIVNMQGSVRTFYAGNILTGNSSGLDDVFSGSTLGSSPIHNNFQIAGDLQNLYVSGSVGTTLAGNYRTGLEMRIGGRLGNVHIVNAFNGSVSVFASPSSPQLNIPFQEEEYHLLNGQTAGGAFLGFYNTTSGGQLSGAVVNNDAQTNAPFAYSAGASQGISWTGTLQGSTLGDGIDNYSLPLMAGQAVSLELQSEAGGVHLGVYDPLGRLVATDAAGPSGSNVEGKQFQFTTKVPGIYRLAVVSILDDTYTGAEVGGDTYTLNAKGVGDLSFGGTTVGGITHFRNSGNGVAVRTGDLGAWYGVGDVTGSTVYENAIASPIYISRGNLRALYGNNIGKELPVTQNEYLSVQAPRGSVGYVRAQNQLDINPDAADAAGDPVQSQAIGGDYQRVEAGGDLNSNLVAVGNIGTVLVASINSGGLIDFQPCLSAGTGGASGGNIDMVYVTGDVGDDGTGPAIYTGRDGNIKYFHVGGTLFRDRFFGGSLADEQIYSFNTSVRLTDDSGAVALVSPTKQTVTTSGGVTTTVEDVADGSTINNPTTGTEPSGTIIGSNTTTTTNADGSTVSVTTGRLGIVSYGVRTGGQVIARIDSGSGIRITTLSGTGGSFDVADVDPSFTTNAALNGSPVVSTNATTTTVNGVTTTTASQVGFQSTRTVNGVSTTVIGTQPQISNQFLLAGSRPINVFNLDGNGTNITTIANSTGGELVSTSNIASAGFIIGRTLGRIQASTPAEVYVPGNLTSSATTPFDAFANGIGVTGNVIGVSASAGVGDVQIGQRLGILQPNNDGKNAKGVFDGISGRVEANQFDNVQIGEGIAFAGSGGQLDAGVFADNALVSLSGTNADVRGPIISKGTIGTISLVNGSIIGTRVGTFGDFTAGLYSTNLFTLPEQFGTVSFKRLQISGNGGIIGSGFGAGAFGSIDVGGFGILTSQFLSTASSSQNGTITAGGLGIRFVDVDVGSSLNTLAATGSGKPLDVSQFSASVRQTSRGGRRRFDAATGRLLDGTNDLNRLLGTSKSRPVIRGVTNSGVMEDIRVTGQGNLNSLSAYAITSTDEDTPVTSSAFPTRLSLANTIGSIDVANGISGLQVRSGEIGSVTVGGNVARAEFTASGAIGTFTVGKNVRGTVSINAQGDGGSIGSLIVNGGLYGVVGADQGIGTIAAGSIAADIETSRGIHKVAITDDLLRGAVIRANRAIDQVIVGGDIQDGATIDARSIGKLRVAGTNDGTITTDA